MISATIYLYGIVDDVIVALKRYQKTSVGNRIAVNLQLEYQTICKLYTPVKYIESDS